MNFILANKVIIEDPTPEMLAYCIDKIRSKKNVSFYNRKRIDY